MNPDQQCSEANHIDNIMESCEVAASRTDEIEDQYFILTLYGATQCNHDNRTHPESRGDINSLTVSPMNSHLKYLQPNSSSAYNKTQFSLDFGLDGMKLKKWRPNRVT